MSIEILLATHNGAKHLAPLLDSLLAQTERDWKLTVRDDLSVDDTPHILRNYAARHPDRITLQEGIGGRIGMAGNFAVLMVGAKADHVMFCHQGDAWHTDKIARTLDVMRMMESIHGPDTPLLVHADARIVDEAMKPVAASRHRRERLWPVDASLARLLAQNVVYGNTMIVNQSLVRLANPIPPQGLSYDHWLALCAAACGHIAFLDAPVLDARQAPRAKRGYPQIREFRESARISLLENVVQAEVLLEALRDRLPPMAKRVIADFTQLYVLPRPARAAAMAAGGYLRRPWYRNIPVMMVA